MAVVLFALAASCADNGRADTPDRRGVVLQEGKAPQGIIKGVSQATASPNGNYIILSDRDNGTSLLYDRAGRQLAIIAPTFELADSFVTNRHVGFPMDNLLKIAEWTDHGKPVPDSVKRHWLRHAFYSATFDSDSTYKVFGWIDGITAPPDNSFGKCPAMLYYRVPNQLYRVQPLKVTTKLGYVAAFGQDIHCSVSDGLYYADCHNDSLGRVVAAFDSAGVTQFVMGDQPREHWTSMVLKYRLYTIRLALLGRQIAYSISTLPYVYICERGSTVTTAIPLKTSCDNGPFFDSVRQTPSMDGIRANLSLLKLSVENIGRISDDSLVVVWSCSNGKMGDARVNTRYYCYVNPSTRAVSETFNLTAPEGGRIRYVHYDETRRQLIVFALCSDEKWRMYYEPLH